MATKSSTATSSSSRATSRGVDRDRVRAESDIACVSPLSWRDTGANFPNHLAISARALLSPAHALLQPIEIHRLGDHGAHRLGDVLLRLQPLDLLRRQPDVDALRRPGGHRHPPRVTSAPAASPSPRTPARRGPPPSPAGSASRAD